MAVERFLASEASDGESLGGGVYRLWLEIDYRNNGQEWIQAAEVDGSERFIETHYRIMVQGAGTVEGVVPAGQKQRIPQSGTLNGLRIDGGRTYSVSLW